MTAGGAAGSCGGSQIVFNVGDYRGRGRVQHGEGFQGLWVVCPSGRVGNRVRCSIRCSGLCCTAPLCLRRCRGAPQPLLTHPCDRLGIADCTGCTCTPTIMMVPPSILQWLGRPGESANYRPIAARPAPLHSITICSMLLLTAAHAHCLCRRCEEAAPPVGVAFAPLLARRLGSATVAGEHHVCLCPERHLP